MLASAKRASRPKMCFVGDSSVPGSRPDGPFQQRTTASAQLPAVSYAGASRRASRVAPFALIEPQVELRDMPHVAPLVLSVQAWCSKGRKMAQAC